MGTHQTKIVQRFRIASCPVAPNCALAIWYNEVRDMPFDELKHWMLEGITAGNQHPRVGAFWSVAPEEKSCTGRYMGGELAHALTYVPESYWEQNPEQLREYLVYLNKAWSATGDEDFGLDC
jgi:hypothetical protein